MGIDYEVECPYCQRDTLVDEDNFADNITFKVECYFCEKDFLCESSLMWTLDSHKLEDENE